eukprot:scaffold18987_cov109-Isochrysis_galbana.AAC.6
MALNVCGAKGLGGYGGAARSLPNAPPPAYIYSDFFPDNTGIALHQEGNKVALQVYIMQTAGAASTPTHTILVEKASDLVYAGEQTSNTYMLHVRRTSAHNPTGNARGCASLRRHHREYARGDPSDACAQVPARTDAGDATGGNTHLSPATARSVKKWSLARC